MLILAEGEDSEVRLRRVAGAVVMDPGGRGVGEGGGLSKL